MTITKYLHEHKKANDFTQFYKKLEGFVPELKKFIAGSLKVAEDQGLLDIGFYSADDMLDEIFLETFNAYLSEIDTAQLHRSLFKMAIQKMEAIKEQEVPDDVNYHTLLKTELKTLNEKFTTDGDGDRITFDELDDISYTQKQGWSKQIYLDETLERQLVDKLELHEASLLSDEKRRLLGLLYAAIPTRSKTVIELLIFGTQNAGSISQILDVPQDVVDKILFKVKEKFKLI